MYVFCSPNRKPIYIDHWRVGLLKFDIETEKPHHQRMKEMHEEKTHSDVNI